MKTGYTICAAMLITLAVSGCSYAGNHSSVKLTQAQTRSAETQSRQVIQIQSQKTTAASPAGEAAVIHSEGTILQERILPPAGFRRTPQEAGSFGEFVRNYPMKPDNSPVLLYDGSEKSNQAAHEAVFAMHIEPEDFQQCADSVMRIYGEYFYSKGAYDKIRFHLVSGFLFDFDTWSAGNKLQISGNNASWVRHPANDSSPDSFERYLRILFAYASTLSMAKESEAIAIEQVQAGDIFIKGGSPGHVVMVADVCENEAGEKAFLLAQGYMPAQEFHILKNPQYESDPWYYVSGISYPFVTPEYIFSDGSFKRPVYLQ